MSASHRMMGVGAVVLAALLWGSTGTIQTMLPADRDPLAVGALRNLIGAAALLVLAFAGRQSRGAFSALPWGRVCAAGVAIALYNLSFFGAVSQVGVGIGTAITIGSAPIWATLMEIAFARLFPTRLRLLGQTLAIAGVVILVLAGVGGGTTPQGIGLALTAGICYATYSLITSGIGLRAPSATVAAATFSVAGLFTLPLLFVLTLDWLWSAEALAAILFLGVIATGLSYALYTWGLRHVAASTAVTLALTEPVTAWILATVVVGEPLSAQKVLGAALVLAGLTVVTVFSARRS
ncbi:DMT family transporter [Actibacterium pelagium]|uniref:Membrane protein n=1 Tax=Actibacterium pelagium TaxID=2029103 RepID=A0A917ELN2_9RHOB|nr:DMT family transporter [Actibacterium pelagium]GGE52924.1 membrane protein [Actibacterium pelagium]